jgi:RNA recognition motif-containing protein
MKNIYVGNLSYSTMEQDLETAFSQFGQVERVSIIRDRETGQPRGFGFVEMPDDGAADNAINGLNGSDLHGRTLTVNEARPKAAGAGGGGFERRGPGGGNRSGGGFKRRESRW